MGRRDGVAWGGRGCVSLQDALAGKLNKHRQRSFRRAAWPKQTRSGKRGEKEKREKEESASTKGVAGGTA